ncbi:hypothetical protein [Desulfovibrio psychrotolerans]|uniref:Uncharacterized protein n=1 Tax=Desulfovibrio psychrotolerans TaxID=415242 RepID=A0A7J0BX59_9BACT|nr:hypothetical protein [Desulfovibrio psychrotolerans]GFM38296.1 hypothetical protein DSM19430T_29800 [Desulfovibrio psychrotolerans]
MKTIAILYPLADRTTRPLLRAAQELAAQAYAVGMKEQGATVLVPLSSHEETMLVMDRLAAVHLICMPGWKEDTAVSLTVRTAMYHGVSVHRFYPPNLCLACGPAIEAPNSDALPCAWWPCPHGVKDPQYVRQ